MHKMFEKNVSNPIKTLGKASSLLLLLICFLPITACANSSWVWIAETRPIDILPFVVVGTLVFETMVILFMARPQNKKKALAVICLGNLLSFLAPYVLRFLGEVQVPTFGKYYIVGTIFLAATLAVEFPIEYYMLVKDSQRKRWLVAAIILANIVSTGSVALIERTFCRGYWV